MRLEGISQLVKGVMPGALKRAIGAALSPDLSQSGEVTVLRQLVKEVECQKFIVDVGANDGVTISNSLPFIDAGWRGILIEPAPAGFNKLNGNHGQRETVTSR
jgi:hypothetical protein